MMRFYFSSFSAYLIMVWALSILRPVSASSSSSSNAASENAIDWSKAVIVNTWQQNGFSNATEAAWQGLVKSSGDRLAAVVAGCSKCEELQCDGTVGYGGSPDERGETTLDALIMDGPHHTMGAVGDLRRVKNAIGVARAVMDHTKHSFLVGESATQFALGMGFPESNLSTAHSMQMWKEWRETNCQPNYRYNVKPDPRSNCGPYTPQRKLLLYHNTRVSEERPLIDSKHHDTIGIIVRDPQGDFAVGTSTNGAAHKIPGSGWKLAVTFCGGLSPNVAGSLNEARVGDSPLPGAGAYVDNDAGAAAGTGDGDVLLRFLPCYQAVEYMRNGVDPSVAGQKALHRIVQYYPNFQGAMVTMNKSGHVGAACHGLPKFPYSVRRSEPDRVEIKWIDCTN